MSIFPSYNDLYKKQQKKLIPAFFKKGIISQVNPSAHTANIYFVDNSQNIIKNIPMAKSIDITTVKVGSRCKVDLFDESNPQDMVVNYIW